MPAIIKLDLRSGKNRDQVVGLSASALLRHVSPGDPPSSTILRSSFSFQHDSALADSVESNKNGFAHAVIRAWQHLLSSFSFQHGSGPATAVVPNKNGFAHTVIRAWQQDLHLRIRPDDVWLAILTQFSFVRQRKRRGSASLFRSP